MQTTKYRISKLFHKVFCTNKSRKVLAVLGMHRSGTSCLTGLLEDAGVYLGNVSKKNPFNLKGNQENLRIMQLHDSILEENGAAWNKPPQISLAWSEKKKNEVKDIIREYNGISLWAFKDPRALFTLDGWLEVIPDLCFIGTFRHPEAVAQSLYNRGKMPQKEAYNLWDQYNKRLLAYHKKFHFDVINFDLEPDAYKQSVSNALEKLGISHSLEEFHFFDSSLRHAKFDSTMHLPKEIESTYNKLLSVSV